MTTPVKGYAGASEWLIGSQLDKGAQSAVAIGASAFVTQDIVVNGDNELSVGVQMTGAATTDLAVTIIPFKSDGVTPMTAITIPPTYSNGPTMGTGVVEFTATYDISGYTKVRVSTQNKNAGAQTINNWWWQLAPN